MENLGGMERHRSAFTLSVLIDNVAAALPHDLEAKSFRDKTDLAGAWAKKLGHQTAISIVERLRRNFRDLFAIGNTVFPRQPHGILDVLDGLFVSVAWAVAARERRTANQTPAGMAFEDHG
jgi:hypothetical protein